MLFTGDALQSQTCIFKLKYKKDRKTYMMQTAAIEKLDWPHRYQTKQTLKETNKNITRGKEGNLIMIEVVHLLKNCKNYKYVCTY